VNPQIREALRFLVMFPMMILSLASSGVFVLGLFVQHNLVYLIVLLPLLFASTVSCRGVSQFISTMEKANIYVR
jgi:hypothetical protein